MSIRMAASCGHPRQERSLPRGARISRVFMWSLPSAHRHGRDATAALAIVVSLAPRRTCRGCLSGPTGPGSVPPMAVGTSPYDTDGADGAATEPIRVLIADDEPALRGALADLLEHEDDVVLIGSA